MKVCSCSINITIIEYGDRSIGEMEHNYERSEVIIAYCGAFPWTWLWTFTACMCRIGQLAERIVNKLGTVTLQVVD